mmetsp:Transcript_45801/g.71770  ORF Transcript_45801/g.71770 Transcript_45801/m.71770 type:complete len:99 (+) Transcript_45801:339-635(+)
MLLECFKLPVETSSNSFRSSFPFRFSQISPIANTETIGHTEANDKIPKPSVASRALPNPNPNDITRGTVTGPVVTPAESQATFTKTSPAGIVKITART